MTSIVRTLFAKEEKAPGFGTFIGVFVPCILMLFGVIIFLRLGWITGQVGLPLTLLMVTLGASIAILTALSVSAIATNIELGKGGAYYILSRSLGLEIGSAIGLPLFIKQALSVAFCVVGFAESVHDLMPQWSIPTIGVVTLIVFTVCACASLSGALKLQLAIFVALAASLVALFTGGDARPSDANIYVPLETGSLSFWGMFAIFFPAMTGMESSISLSGDLRNPSRSLPIGTISALLVAYAIYMAIPLFLVQHVSLERLASDPFVMQDVARIPGLIVMGIWAATLSSALGGLLGAPRTLQAIADDGVVPRFFGKTYGPKKEPIIATFATFIIALVSIYFGSINQIAPLLTMICLICYCFLNLSAGFETIMANPSWRPRFRVHWLVSFAGAFLCILAMLMIDAGNALLAIALVAALFLATKRRNLKTSWEDMTQGLMLYISRFAVHRLAYNGGVAKSWRPHFLVFTKKPDEHSHNLVRFSQAISQSRSFLTMASIVPQPFTDEREKKEMGHSILQKLKSQNIEAFVHLHHAVRVSSGMLQMIENYGLGPLVPDTIVFGGIYEDPAAFAAVVRKGYEKHCNIVLLNDKNEESQTLARERAIARDIHVWWDQNQANCNLMLVLAYMLQRNPAWHKARINLNGIVASELQKSAMMAEFKTLGISRRLPLNAQVFVSAEPEAEKFSLIREFSKRAGIVFTGLRPPHPEELSEEYGAYLKGTADEALSLPPSALILSSEHTPFKDVLS